MAHVFDKTALKPDESEQKSSPQPQEVQRRIILAERALKELAPLPHIDEKNFSDMIRILLTRILDYGDTIRDTYVPVSHQLLALLKKANGLDVEKLSKHDEEMIVAIRKMLPAFQEKFKSIKEEEKTGGKGNV